MKAKFVQISPSNIYYPVGSNIQTNLPVIMSMIEKLKQILDPNKDVILWCRGSSGAIIAGIIASQISNARVSHVKKDGEGSHSGDVSCLPSRPRKTTNVIVDDFMASGETINAIFAKMKENKVKAHVLCVGGCVYTKSLKFKPDFIIAGEVDERSKN